MCARKGEAFAPSKRDGAAGRHGTRGKYAAGGGQNGQQDIGHTQGGSQQVPEQCVTGDAPPQSGVQGQRRRDSQHGYRRRRQRRPGQRQGQRRAGQGHQAQSAPAAALLQHPQRRCRRQQGKERGFAHLPWAVPYGGERVGQRAGELFLQRPEQDRRGQGGVECQHIRQELFHTITSREYMRRAIRKSVAFRPRIL